MESRLKTDDKTLTSYFIFKTFYTNDDETGEVLSKAFTLNDCKIKNLNKLEHCVNKPTKIFHLGKNNCV